jgi:ubiquinone biosynthesis protein COQ9
MSQALLRRAFSLIPTHGFTRKTLALSSPNAPLSETAVSALFGQGDEAPKTLIRAWMEEGRRHMSLREGPVIPSSEDHKGPGTAAPRAFVMEDVLLKRLDWNVPVLPHLKDVSASVKQNEYAVVNILLYGEPLIGLCVILYFLDSIRTPS